MQENVSSSPGGISDSRLWWWLNIWSCSLSFQHHGFTPPTSVAAPRNVRLGEILSPSTRTVKCFPGCHRIQPTRRPDALTQDETPSVWFLNSSNHVFFCCCCCCYFLVIVRPVCRSRQLEECLRNVPVAKTWQKSSGFNRKKSNFFHFLWLSKKRQTSGILHLLMRERATRRERIRTPRGERSWKLWTEVTSLT